MPETAWVDTRGPFSLAELAGFGYGHLHTQPWDGVWRLAFCLDDGSGQAGVEVRQTEQERLELTVHAPPGRLDSAVEPAAVEQSRRIMSCDHDGAAFAALGDRDPVLAQLIAAAPGLRPPVFASPYEAALWCLLVQRRSRRQATGLRQRLGQAHGVTFTLAGHAVTAVPTPRALLDVTGLQGVPDVVVERLHAVARAALDGGLDVAHLTALDPQEAIRDLQTIPGIGPFSSELIVVRGCGLSDVLPLGEPRSRAMIAALYDEPEPLDDARYRALAERWRPFRTWAVVLARAAGARVLPPDRVPGEAADRAGRRA